MSSIVGTVAERTLQGSISATNGDIEGAINKDTSLDGDLQRGNAKLLFENTAERTLQGSVSAINGDIEGAINEDTSLDGDLQRGNVKLLFENTAEKGQVLVISDVSESGKPGKFKAASVYTRVSDEYIQFSTDDETWKNVVPMSDIKGDQGLPGKDGATFTPAVSSEGDLSWTNNGELENPEPVNIRGPRGLPGDEVAVTSITNSEIEAICKL